MFGIVERLRALRYPIFTGRAAMVKWWSELQMQLTVTTPQVKRGFRKARRLF